MFRLCISDIYGFRPSRRQLILMAQPTDSRTDQHQGNNIEVLSEWLKITEEDVSEETTEYTDKMSVVLAPATA